MSKQKRLIFAAAAITLLLVLLISSCGLMMNADHDCSGTDCPVCALAASFRYTAKLLLFGFVVAFCATAAILLKFTAPFLRKNAFRATLVSLRVKLSD